MSRGVIAAGDIATAEAGAVLLRAGANAVDAAVAAAFASFVAEPLLASPGGAGVAISGSAADGFEIDDFFTVVPGLGAQPSHALDFGPITIDFGPTTQDFHIGRGAAAVPTALFGLLTLHARGGRASLADVLAPAIRLARQGCVLSESLRWIVQMLTPIVIRSDDVAAFLSADGVVAPAGRPVRNPALADFLEQLGHDGLSLARGAFTDAVVEQFGPRAGGLLTRADLERYEPARRPPLRVPYGDRVLLTNPPPSSGGALVGIGLRAATLAGLHRAEFRSPAHYDRLVDALMTVSAARRTDVDQRVAGARGGAALFNDADLERWRSTALGVGEERHLGGTTHISVLDKHGQTAAMTLTNGEGCGFGLAELGIHLNNFLGEEDINPGGFHKLAAGTRMTTMMAPSVVMRDGRPELVVGSGGSNRIRSAIMQAVMSATLHGRPLQEAIEAPRVHIEGDRMWFERAGLPEATVARLLHRFPNASVFEEQNMFFGGAHCVGLHGGFGDARRGGASIQV